MFILFFIYLILEGETYTPGDAGKTKKLDNLLRNRCDQQSTYDSSDGTKLYFIAIFCTFELLKDISPAHNSYSHIEYSHWI